MKEPRHLDAPPNLVLEVGTRLPYHHLSRVTSVGIVRRRVSGSQRCEQQKADREQNIRLSGEEDEEFAVPFVPVDGCSDQPA